MWWLRDDLRLVNGELVQPRIDHLVIKVASRHGDVGRKVTRLGGQEFAIKRRQWLIEFIGQELHSLAAPRFDQRTTQQGVQQTLGFGVPASGAQAGRVGALLLSDECNVVLFEHRQALLKVLKLLAGDLGERSHEVRKVLVAKQKRQRRRGRLLFAMCVVQQDFGQVLLLNGGPRKWCGRREPKHGLDAVVCIVPIDQQATTAELHLHAAVFTLKSDRSPVVRADRLGLCDGLHSALHTRDGLSLLDMVRRLVVAHVYPRWSILTPAS